MQKIKKEIAELLKPLNLSKIILFGSYAYGTPKENIRDLRLKARKMLQSLIFEQHLGIDIVAESKGKVNHG